MRGKFTGFATTGAYYFEGPFTYWPSIEINDFGAHGSNIEATPSTGTSIAGAWSKMTSQPSELAGAIAGVPGLFFGKTSPYLSTAFNMVAPGDPAIIGAPLAKMMRAYGSTTITGDPEDPAVTFISLDIPALTIYGGVSVQGICLPTGRIVLTFRNHLTGGATADLNVTWGGYDFGTVTVADTDGSRMRVEINFYAKLVSAKL